MIARRRNIQRAGADEFLARLEANVGIPRSSVSLVKAEESIPLERSMYARIEDLLADGSLRRSSELTWPEVEERLGELSHVFGDDRLSVFLCHWPDFAFVLDAENLVASVKGLLLFDGDTVYATTSDLRCGFGVDMYQSEIVHESCFTFDAWSPKKPAPE